MKYLLLIMFFFMLTSCKKEYIQIETTHKTIIKEEVEEFIFYINTNLDNLILVSVENNNKFEYNLTRKETGYELNLVLYNPNSFSNVTFMSNNKEYICNIGSISTVELESNNNNWINIVVDDENKLYIYNKLNSAIIIKDIKVYGGDYVKNMDYNDLIQPKIIVPIGTIYQKEDTIVVYIKYQYQTINYEEVFEVK